MPLKILLLKDLTSTEKILFAIILSYSKKDGCFMKNKKLAMLLNISIRNVIKLINDLKEKNYIYVQFNKVEKRRRLWASEEILNQVYEKSIKEIPEVFYYDWLDE